VSAAVVLKGDMNSQDNAGEILTRLREERGLSPQELGTALGISLAYVRDLEHANEVGSILPLRSVSALASLLKVPPLEIFGECEHPINSMSLSEILKEAIASSGKTVQSLSDQVGWDLENIIRTIPDSLEDISAQHLYEICNGLGLDWRPLLAKICEGVDLTGQRE
jgi:transcriptional regulator with XRE-family HTH domain